MHDAHHPHFQFNNEFIQTIMTFKIVNCIGIHLKLAVFLNT